MGDRSNAPIIIKRKKVVAGGGHHGGAWKVAYADFVTAMMAFFLLMWLLSATTEQQRRGLSDYFAPSVPMSRVSGGGDGMFGGVDLLDDGEIKIDLSGESGGLPIEGDLTPGEARAVEAAAFEQIEQTLLGFGGESLLQQEALRHVITRITDEGLIIEVFAREGAPLFKGTTSEPMPVLEELIQVFARVFGMVTNPVAVDGHTQARPLVVASHPVWDISTGRAEAVRQLLESGGLDSARMSRITGHADRDLAVTDSLSVRNNRIEITLLRVDR